MNAYVLDALTIFIAVLLSELVLDAYRRHRKRARMRYLNRLSVEAKRRARDVAKNRASAGGSGDSVPTVS